MANSTRGRRKASEVAAAESDATSKARTRNNRSDTTRSADSSSTKERTSTATTTNTKASILDSSSEDNNDDIQDITEENSKKKYKQVNDKSTNRRACLRVQRELLRSTTPDRDNRTTVVTNFQTRATLKLSLTSTTNPIEQLGNVIKEFLRELAQADDAAALIPWKQRECGRSRLTQTSELPTTVTGYKPYLNRLYLPRPGSSMNVYINVHIGHNHDFNDLREALQAWLTSSNHGLYYKMLQVEDSSEIGWLLYSTREMDAGALADEIADMIGINVGLRWKTISTGAKNISEKTKVQALCIEVAAKEKWACQTKLLKLYSRSIQGTDKYPNGIRMRFVKLKKDAINMKEKSKLDKLRERQKQFLAGITTVVTYDICQLDYSSNEGTIPTLRQMIMSITSKNDGITPLFHSVDMDWLQEGFTLQFSNDIKEEAETVINTLLPYLTHLFPHAKVEDNFTEETWERCENMVWSDELNMVIDSTAGKDTDNIEQEEDLIGFTFNTGGADNGNFTTEDELPLRPVKSAKSAMPRDDDSVSTLGGAFSRGFVLPTPKHQRAGDRDNQSVISASSAVTMEQYNDLREQVEKVTTASTTQFNAINDKVSQILNSLSALSSTQQLGSASVGNAQAGETMTGSSGDEP